MQPSATTKTPLLMIILIIGIGFLSLISNASLSAPTAADFAELPMFTDLAISPGGKFLAARVNKHNKYSVAIFDIVSPDFRSIYNFKETTESPVRWFRWVTPDHLLVSIKSTYRTWLIVINTANSDVISLFPKFRRKKVRIQDNIVSLLPQDPEHILVQYSRWNFYEPEVYKVPVTKTAKHVLIQLGKPGVFDWMTDRHGVVRLGQGRKRNGSPLLIIRLAGAKKWRSYSRRVKQEDTIFLPMAFASEPNYLYVVSNHESDPAGLYLFDFEADEFIETIFQHPEVDIEAIHFDDETGELRAISFVEDSIKTKYFSRQLIEDDIVTMLRSQFEGMDATIESITDDGDHAIILIQAAGDPGSYYLFDRKTPIIRALPPQYPGLRGQSMGETFATSYKARDGLSIPAFVTLPPGMKDINSASMIPFVILPHGGPAGRDFLQFHYWVQFLVTRGYGVLQMNFRGSAGYGQSFERAGDREWGQAMQDDITDGVNWLIQDEYADPDRVAILGGSYGGYAALMGAVKTPDLYQCAVSFAGISDLPDLIHQEGAYATRAIGSWGKDYKTLAKNSPAKRAKDITIPVLLFHGNEDIIVDIDQSVKMAKALKKHGKNYEFIRLENGDHHLSLYVNRLKFLTKTEKFLADCLN